MAHILVAIFGAAVRPNGDPSPTLARRIGCGQLAAIREPRALVLCSGGIGRSGISEATVMSSVLRSRGIRAERLVLDERSVDTFASVVSIAKLVKQDSIERVIICSDAYHVPRIRTLLAMLGVSSEPGPPTTAAGTLRLRIFMRAREAFAFGYDCFLMSVRRSTILAEIKA